MIRTLPALALLWACTRPVADTPLIFEGDVAGECDDGADNDRDGLFDCDDDDCAGSSACTGDTQDDTDPVVVETDPPDDTDPPVDTDDTDPSDDTDDTDRGVQLPQSVATLEPLPPCASAPRTVELDGSGSLGFTGSPLGYTWRVSTAPFGANTSFSTPNLETTSFTADLPGDYIVTLQVADSAGIADDEVSFVLVDNCPPRADAGPDQTVALGSIVQLSGQGSADPDGDAMTYDWTFVSMPAGSTTTLTGATVQPAAVPRFISDQPGLYILQLVVNDGRVDSAPDTSTVTVVAP